MKNGDAITLPERLRTWAEIQANAGGFDDLGEYVSHVLREERRRLEQEALELQLIKAIESGPPRRVTDADWKAVKDLAKKAAAKKKPRHAVKR
jgi:hypothetical protein